MLLTTISLTPLSGFSAFVFVLEAISLAMTKLGSYLERRSAAVRERAQDAGSITAG